MYQHAAARVSPGSGLRRADRVSSAPDPALMTTNLARCVVVERRPCPCPLHMIGTTTHQREDHHAVGQVSTRHSSDTASRRRAHSGNRPVLLSAPVYHPPGAAEWNLQPRQPSRRQPQQALAGAVAAFATALVKTPDHLPENLLA